jgi:hypothetical protein
VVARGTTGTTIRKENRIPRTERGGKTINRDG